MQTAQQQASRRRRGLRVLGAVLVAALTAAASLPLAGPAAAQPQDAQSDTAQSQSSVSLAASSISRTGATLTVTGHSTAWYYRRSPSTLGPCSSAVAANTAATLTDLTPATSYTFKAYSDSACATELTAASTDADFTTPGLVLSGYRLAVTEGSSATYSVKLATAPTSDVTVTAARAADHYPSLSVDTDKDMPGNQSTLTFTSTNYSTAQTITVAAAANSANYSASKLLTSIVHSAASSDAGYSGASAANAVSIVDSTAPALSASSVTATGATLAIANRTTAWYYRSFATLGTWGTCTAVQANTSSVTLSSLSAGTEFTYRAYSDSTCSSWTELTDADTRAQFTTPGVVLSTRRLIAPEGSTADYTVRLATAPAGDVTVTVTKASGGDSDLTVDTDSGTAGNQNTLTFTAANWNTPQTVTVAAAEETGATDKAYGAATFNHSATSGYTTTATSALTVTEGDDDVCGGTAAVGGATVTTGGLVDDCNTLLAAKATLAGTSANIDNWATTLAVNSWAGVKATTSGVTHVTASTAGTIPNTLGNLTNLTSLTLSHPRGGSLSGTIPATLGNLTNLVHLNLSGNELSGTIPATLGNLTSLVHLFLSGNELSGTIPATLGNQTNLESLNLSGNALSGPIPSALGNQTDLESLRLSGNALSGPIPSALGNLTNLKGLHLFGNALSGTIPSTLGNLTNLDYLYLNDNALSGPIPSALGNLTNLKGLHLFGNALSGTIPSTLGNLTNLDYLRLSGNALSGPIPSALGNLTNLKGLHLNDNTLSGTIPSTLGNLTNLDYLHLNDNALSGTIPSALGNLTNLDYLYLRDNTLSGTIPSTLGNLTNLKGLHLDDNALSGTIPSALGKLTGLRLFRFGRNRLSGCVPANLLAFLTETQSDGTALAACDGIVLSDAHPSVGENSTAAYTVRLSSAPDADVTVAVTASGDSSITVSPATLTFTSENWSTAQTVTLSAAADSDAAAGTATVTHTATSTDSDYSSASATATATEVDDEPTLSATEITPTRATLRITAHAGSWGRKRTSPTSGTCRGAGGQLSRTSNDLTPGTSYTYKAYSDSSCATELTTDATDAEFTTASGVLASGPSVVVPESSTGQFSVRLATEPDSSVTVTVTGAASGDTDLTFDTDPDTTGSQATLTFSTSDWSTPQIVTVAAAADADTTHGTRLLTLTADSSDSVYDDATATVTAVESDDDAVLSSASVTVSAAVLTLANHRGSWYLGAGGACNAQGYSHTVHLSGLTPGVSYTYKAYSDSACATELTTDTTDARFTTGTAQTSQSTVGSEVSGEGGTAGGSGGGGGGSGRADSIRLSDATRYGTATAAANKFVTLVEDAAAAGGSRQQVDTMIVASGKAFPDALAASALARTLRAPVVLTPPKQLDAAVRSFIARNRITNVVIVGGTEAVSKEVADALSDLTGDDDIERHAGPDRYSTAALIAQAAGAPGSLCGTATPTVIVTTGQNYPDALVAGPLAYRGRHPIVLTEPDRLPAPTAAYLAASGAKQALLVGGTKAVSKDVVDAIEALGLTTTRVSGTDRADTSAKFARRFSALSGPSCYRKDTIGLATGFAFPDALAAAALLGHYGAPLLLTSPKGVPQPLIDYAAAGRLTPDLDQPPIVTIGGRNAVPSNHPTKLLAALPR